MNKDINLVIEETKAELLNFVNNKLQVLPISVMDLIIDNISIQLRGKLLKPLTIKNHNKMIKTWKNLTNMITQHK